MLLAYRQVWIVSFALLSILIMLLPLSPTKADQNLPSVQERADSNIEPVVLEQGKRIERELAGGEAHSYEIKLTAGQFLQVVVEQKGVDVVAILFDPDSKKLVEVNSPNVTQGSETVLTVTEMTGTYHLEVRSLRKTAPAGRYEIKIAELRTTMAQDKERVAAHQIFAEGELLRANGSAESLQKAIEKYQQALQVFQAIHDRDGEVAALHNIGFTYNLLGKHTTALDYLKRAVLLRKDIGDKYAEATTLNTIGFAYYSQGDLEKALDYYKQSLILRRAINDHGGEARTLNNMGLVYNLQGDLEKALDCYRQALPMIKEAGDTDAEAATLNNIGSIYNSLGEKEIALGYYKQVQSIVGGNNPRGEAYTLNNMGSIYSSLGRQQEALDCFNQARPIMKNIGERRGEAYTLNNIGLVYNSLGATEKALDCFNQASLYMNDIKDYRGVAATLNNIGAVYYSLGQTEKALGYYNQALLIVQDVKDRSGEAYTLNNIGSVYNLLGERQKALNYYNQALMIRKDIKDRSGEAYTLNNIGSIYYSLKEEQKALDCYKKALVLMKDVGDRSGEAKVIYNLARFERDQNNLVEAQAKVEAAIKLSESIRISVINQELRSSYFASVQEQYEFYIDLLMQLHQQNPSAGYYALAFEASERARARSLLELLTESHAEIRQGVDIQLVEKEKSLQQRLTDKAEILVRLKNSKGKESQVITLEKEINQLTTEFQQVQTEIRQKSPRYAALTQPQPLSLKEIQEQVLDQDTLLLEYALGKENSYLWAVTTTSISSYRLPKREEIEALAKNVYQLVSSYENALTNTENTYWQAATKLSQIIFGPVANQLGKKRLLIVSDGVLQHIPFAGLPLPTNTSTRKGRKTAVTVRPLFIDHEIINEPSASTVAILRRELTGRQSATKTVVVLADPVFSPDDMRVKRVPEKAAYSNTQPIEPVSESIKELSLTRSLLGVDGRGTLARLHFSRDEADAIRALVGTSEYKEALDFDANLATAT
ncbi:MAG: tetratricopeptide repeat protein, partial [Acidobacteriota bacterium]